MAYTGAGQSRRAYEQSPDVVLVTVRDHKALESVAETPQVLEVRDHQIDTEHRRIGEHNAAVDRKGVLTVLDDQTVQPDLSETAERNDPQGLPAVSNHGPAVAAWRSCHPAERACDLASLLATHHPGLNPVAMIAVPRPASQRVA